MYVYMKDMTTNVLITNNYTTRVEEGRLTCMHSDMPISFVHPCTTQMDYHFYLPRRKLRVIANTIFTGCEAKCKSQLTEPDKCTETELQLNREWRDLPLYYVHV